MLHKLTWKSFIFSTVPALLCAVIAGILLGYFTLWIILTLIILLIWNYYQQLRLSNWLWQDHRIVPPTARGHWEVIFYGLHQLQLRNKKRRKELAVLIKRFRSGAESLPDAIVVMTDEGTIFWCNRLAEELLSFRWPLDNGQNILNLLRYPSFASYFHQADFSQPLHLQLHNQRYVEFRIMPYSEGSLLVIARDITQIKQSDLARRNFFNNASHELGTPLTLLKGYLELLDEQTINQYLPAQGIATMRQQVDRMDNLVKQLLALSRVEFSAESKQQQPIDFHALLLEIRDEIVSLNHGQHQIQFDLITDCMVLANKEELRSCVSNLIENAIKYTPANGSIVIGLKQHQQQVEFSVTDTGVGIANQHLPYLTERFYRVDSSRSRKTGGAGIGLAIVKHVLQQHNSQLVISSKLGQGSRFSFSLDLLQPSE